jgi:hydrogenase expression/formation protein HypE
VISQPPGLVLLKTQFGTERIVDMLVGEQLPRIC